MNNFSSSQLGYFLEFRLWQEAKKLLDFQIQQMDKNKHYNTFSMFYYKQIAPTTSEISTETYFKQRVANNLFYGLKHEFALHDYVIPKASLGLRNHKFITYPMRVLYYSIGLYILKLSEDLFRENVKSNINLKSYYGGDLHFERDLLIIDHKTTFYRPNYKLFKSQVRKQATTDSNSKLVLKLDIQNYFDNISVPTLLENLDRYVKPSIKQHLKFDGSTKEQLIFYFNYISANKGGIPQADNDIISGFLGNLYLFFTDLLIDTVICEYQSFIQEYQVIRFVDDTFIVINFLEDTEQQKQESIADSLTSQISDLLHYKSSLRLNTKTRLYWLRIEAHKKELLKDLKKVSPEYYCNDDDDREEKPQNKLENIFDELEKLKYSSIDISSGYDGSLQDEILKEVYDKAVNQLLDKEDNKARIEDIFTEFNFDLVKAKPQEIIILICKNKTVSDNFLGFLQDKINITTRDLYLIIKFLCQTEFKNEELFKKLEINNSFNQIANIYRQSQLYSNYPGYYELSAAQVLLLSEHSHILEQIQLRVFNEKIGSYSVALNHLLNEIHAICWQFDLNKKHKYEAEDAVRYLQTKCVPHEIRIDIRNLFDRRNRNTVSHPGSGQNIAWGVTKEEYFKYSDAIGKCLSFILNNCN